MFLVMAIGEKILERMAVDSRLIKDDEYLQACRKIMEKKNWLSVLTYGKDPQFYLEVSSDIKPSRYSGTDLN